MSKQQILSIVMLIIGCGIGRVSPLLSENTAIAAISFFFLFVLLDIVQAAFTKNKFFRPLTYLGIGLLTGGIHINNGKAEIPLVVLALLFVLFIRLEREIEPEDIEVEEIMKKEEHRPDLIIEVKKEQQNEEQQKEI